MSLSRKCPKCSTWNGDNDYCTNCNHLLNYQKQLEQEDKQRAIDYKNRIPDPLEQFFQRWKASKSLPLRMVYYVVYSVWFAIFAFYSFIMAIILFGAG